MQDIAGSHVMLAGSVGDAWELLAYCEESIQQYEVGGNELAVTEFLESLRAAVRKRKAAINNAYLSAHFGTSYSDFLKLGKDQFSAIKYAEICDDLEALPLGAELILSSFSDDEALLMHVSSSGKVSWVDHYAAIGTGATICNVILKQRPYDDAMPFRECLYRVLEAKVAAECDPFVGQATAIEVLTLDHQYSLNEDFILSLIEQVELRKTIPEFHFEDRFLIEQDSN